jgi:hypothetical protein
MYLGAGGRGRLAGEMRRRVAALIALFGIAAIPAVSDGAQPGHAAMPAVSVKPPAGSARTHFAVSFRAAQATGPAVHHIYRITADVQGHGRCQSTAVAEVPPTRAGSTVRVVLSPSRPAGWCVGTFRGTVWDVITVPCPVGKACPDILPAPRIVGRFTFRVTRN